MIKKRGINFKKFVLNSILTLGNKKLLYFRRTEFCFTTIVHLALILIRSCVFVFLLDLTNICVFVHPTALLLATRIE